MTGDIPHFIARWQESGAAERANYQLFLSELCDVLDVPRPDPTTPDAAGNAYVFEKSVPLPHGSIGRIDLYRRGCFRVGSETGRTRGRSPLEESEARAAAERGVAARYRSLGHRDGERRGSGSVLCAQPATRRLRTAAGRRLIVVDVGESLTLYEFTAPAITTSLPGSSGVARPLSNLEQPEVRELLRWSGSTL
jgi:hypothetical protein